MEISEHLDARADSESKIPVRDAREVGPVGIALHRLTTEIERLDAAEQMLREHLSRVLGPQRTDRLHEIVKNDHEEQAPLANDLDTLYTRVCAIRGSLIETTERLHL